MLKSHERFHSKNGKRYILIAEDEEINLLILTELLKDDYEILVASDGKEALDKAYAYGDLISLFLLDIEMPVRDGLSVLAELKGQESLKGIPVIILTDDHDVEASALHAGASDFISKPYPSPEVVKARVKRAIELHESRQILETSERDVVTGLYNLEFFIPYCRQYDQFHPDADMDALYVDVRHFHVINERFGSEYGNQVLSHIGSSLREAVVGLGGMVCRREADHFILYVPHGLDYPSILAKARVDFPSNLNGSNLLLQMGVYPHVDKSLDVPRRFDRAKAAWSLIKNNMAKRVSYYDETLSHKEIYEEQLLEGFEKALEEHEFVVYYQPKFDISGKEFVLASAEALVRWNHPTFGLVSPGVFIPLFEGNGLIGKMDEYVWEETARQIAEWKKKYGMSVPVSVNVSRIDLYSADLAQRLSDIVTRHGLEKDDIHLEITESAYSEEPDQLIEAAKALRLSGFKIEMDDFGSGYSSLSMISRLPIDAIKLDMYFIRNIFADPNGMRLLGIVLDLARYLGVPLIAEGVETEEQAKKLQGAGCHYAQGYYFSRPIPGDQFAALLD